MCEKIAINNLPKIMVEYGGKTIWTKGLIMLHQDAWVFYLMFWEFSH